MNESKHQDPMSDVPWPTRRERARVPDTSMLPAGDRASPAAVGVLNKAVQGAHDGIDRLADRAAPAVQGLGERLAAAEEALREKADRLRDARDQWVDRARSTVRERPLSALAAALAVGAVLAVLMRSRR